MNKTQEIEAKIRQWAEERNLIKGSDPLSQVKKLCEEVDEWMADYASGVDSQMEFGDIHVVLLIMEFQLNYSREKCLEMAYEKIKDRKGKMVDGVFVKEAY